MRILQVHNRYRRLGGEDAVVAAESELLRESGHEVEIHEATNPAGTLAAARALAAAPWNSSAAAGVRAAVERFRPDVAHVHNTWFALTPATLPVLRAAGVPVVMTLHNYRLLCANSQLFRDGRPCEDCVVGSPWQAVLHRCYNESVACSIPAAATIALHRRRLTWHQDVAVFLALTEFARDRFIAGGLPAERIRVKPHFVADPGPRPAPPSRSREICYVGRLAPEKGVDVLLDAFSAAGDLGLELVVVGDGDQADALRRRGDPRVRFTGWLPPDQVAERLRRARALAFPSRTYETFGLAMVEAMAAGVPVLASDLGGTPDILGAGTGLLVPPGDSGAWAAALAWLLDDARVDRAGEQAREFWSQRFSRPAALPALEEAYHAGLGLTAVAPPRAGTVVPAIPEQQASGSSSVA